MVMDVIGLSEGMYGGSCSVSNVETMETAADAVLSHLMGDQAGTVRLHTCKLIGLLAKISKLELNWL